MPRPNTPTTTKPLFYLPQITKSHQIPPNPAYSSIQLLPTTKLMADTGTPFDQSVYLPAVVSYYQTSDGDLLSMPFNSSTPALWYNKDARRAT